MSADRDAFLRAVVAAPDDDLPRLVYADWLDERGESARAEVIRLQCASARLPDGDPGAVDLDARAEALLAEHEQEWLGDWHDRLVRWTFRRGFLDGVEIEPGPFLDHGEALFDRHPIRKVKFIGPDGDGAPADAVPALAAAPHLARVRALDFSGNSPGPAWARAIAAARHLTNIEELNFYDDSPTGEGAVDRDGFRALASAPHLQFLQLLDLGTSNGGTLGYGVVDLLAESAFAGRLRSLALRNRDIPGASVTRLASNSAFAGLNHLNLAGCTRMTQRAVEALLSAPHLTQLTDVYLERSAGLPALARSPGLGRITRLGLTFHGLGAGSPDDWMALATSPHLRLTHLRLYLCSRSGERFLDLLHAPVLSGLRELTVVGGWRIGDAVIDALIRPDRFPYVTSLSLAVSDIADSGVIRLADSPLLARLAALDLSGNGLGPDGHRALLDSPHVSTRLARLDLSGNRFDDVTFAALAACPRLAGLTWLSVPFDLTREDAVALRSSPYLRRLTYLDLGSIPDADAAMTLALPGGLPRLRKLFLCAPLDPAALAALRRRFGPRLRVYPDD
jgi:uncharacterized protein (TIGR02996 family)